MQLSPEFVSYIACYFAQAGSSDKTTTDHDENDKYFLLITPNNKVVCHVHYFSMLFFLSAPFFTIVYLSSFSDSLLCL